MGPKFDPDVVYTVMVRCRGGEPPPNASLAPKIGAYGLPPKMVSDDIVKSTQEFKGINVMVKLTIQNRKAQITVVPCAASLIIQALNEPYRDRKKVKFIKHNGDLSFEQICDIGRKMRPRSQARELSGTVKEVLGACQSIGCTINKLPPHEVIDKINDGSLVVPKV
ncbi:hypothetical protein ACOME3_008324 [Neoechinorhynchus agilis]